MTIAKKKKKIRAPKRSKFGEICLKESEKFTFFAIFGPLACLAAALGAALKRVVEGPVGKRANDANHTK